MAQQARMGLQMVGVPKAGVNWAEIELAWKGGVSAPKLARLHGITRQAIEKRAKRHGWERNEAAAVLAETETGQRTTDPETTVDRRIIANGQRTLANMHAVLELLEQGISVRLVAQRIGMADSTLRDWLKDDPDFGRLAMAAQAEAGIRRVGVIDKAANGGEWRAAMALLERSPTTREEFAPRPVDLMSMGGGVTVQLVLRSEGAMALLQNSPGEQPAAGPAIIEHEGDI